MTRSLFLLSLLSVILSGCSGQPAPSTDVSLPEARKGFQTRLLPPSGVREAVAQPPQHLFRVVQYDSSPGKLAAYLTPDPKDGKKHPAIIWITGGDCNTIGDVWSAAPELDDQTAAAYRQAGLVMMFPSLRGGNINPGLKEGFLGEVDDVLAAADFLAKKVYVDPARIYLGGHSTGGTLVFLVAASTDRFRAVFSFGPIDDVNGYRRDNPEVVPFDPANAKEGDLRSPIRWTHSVRCPLFVFEGTVKGNLVPLQAIQRTSKNPLIHCYPVSGKTHFSLLAPLNRLIAQKILRDEGATTNLSFTDAELK
jgi:hypothetical protein